MVDVQSQTIKEIKDYLDRKNIICINSSDSFNRSHHYFKFQSDYFNRYDFKLDVTTLSLVFEAIQIELGGDYYSSQVKLKEHLQNTKNWLIAIHFDSPHLSEDELLHYIGRYVPLDNLKPSQHVIFIRNKPMHSEMISNFNLKPISDSEILKNLIEFNDKLDKSDLEKVTKIANGSMVFVYLFSNLFKKSSPNLKKFLEDIAPDNSLEKLCQMVYNDLKITKGFSTDIFNTLVWCNSSLLSSSMVKNINKNFWGVHSSTLTFTIDVMDRYGFFTTKMDTYTFIDYYLHYFRKPEFANRFVHAIFTVYTNVLDDTEKASLGAHVSLLLDGKYIIAESSLECYVKLNLVLANLYDSWSLSEKSLEYTEVIIHHREALPATLKALLLESHARSLGFLNQHQESKKFYMERQAIDLTGLELLGLDSASVYNQIGSIEMKLGNLNESLNWHNKAMSFRQNPSNPNQVDQETTEFLIELYFLMGNMKKVIYYAKKFPKMADPINYITLAKAYAHQKKMDLAKSTLATFDKLYRDILTPQSMSELHSQYDQYINAPTSLVVVTGKYLLSSTLILGVGFFLYKYLKK
ncbi:hypothetical protein DLAC_08950 [Tieghemostelium lacteum]|uniref:Uncharacterized protein n=1 Tax=Tieghemostelium lacteum TaxID=361077 RepID=A0A151Z8S0_TIELA|nr:hypothetical protein DLAC_08950 [Tieghemostelium lacteum]|eukprot:KYQ90338.1 hypothetical protein DLAC_08950 [Tieghemostelium lacteum]